MIVLRLPSPFSSSSLTVMRSPSSLTAPRSPSSKTGSETTYFSLAQLPRSCRRQRSLQKGKSPCTAESVGALQIGHLCVITASFLRSEPGYQCHSERSRPTSFSPSLLRRLGLRSRGISLRFRREPGDSFDSNKPAE